MTADREKTSSLAETLDERTSDESDKAMRTTLVQPIAWPRQAELAKTHYWERLSIDRDEPKRSAASYALGGNTRIGLGPDDPIVQAVNAAKRARVEAESYRQERPCVSPQDADAVLPSQAKTMLLPAIDVLQLMAANVQPRVPSQRVESQPDSQPESQPVEAEPEPEVPRLRRPRSIVLALAAVSVMLTAISISYLVPARSVGPQAKPAAPATPSAETPRAADRAKAAPVSEVVSATRPAKPSVVPAPAAPVANTAVAPQTTEKAAIDALFAGDYALAARHYASLAKAQPEQPAFAEAARILRRNAAAAAE